MPGQDGRDIVGELVVHEGAGTNVDGHRRRWSTVYHRTQSATARSRIRRVNGRTRAGCSATSTNAPGCNNPRCGTVPANEGLGADDAVGDEVVLRLELNRQLLLVQAVRSSDTTDSRFTLESSRSTSYRSHEPHSPLAWHIVRSARWNSSLALAASCGWQATPREPSIGRCRPLVVDWGGRPVQDRLGHRVSSRRPDEAGEQDFAGDVAQRCC